MNLHRPIAELMTTELITVGPETSMIEVAGIFTAKNIHHIPVVTEELIPLGIISKHDYHQAQHYLSGKGWEMAEAANLQVFKTLKAKDVMTKNIVQLEKDEPLVAAVDYFLSNRFHSIIICERGLCIGIVTPYDLLEEMKKLITVLY